MTGPMRTRLPLLRRITAFLCATALAAAVVWTVGTSPAAAQFSGQGLRIVAVVNDDVISAYDLDQRLRFVLVTAGIPVTDDSMQRLAPQVLRTMIEEKIKMQEGEKFGIEPSQDAVAQQIGRFERRNNIPEGALPEVLENNGASIEPFVNQIEAAYVWNRAVTARFGNSVSVSDDEVDAAIAELKAQQGQQEFRIAEIFVPADPADPGDARQTIERLVQELRSGADFAALANSFSGAPSAARGGDLGFVKLEDLGSELAPVAARLSPGQLSTPVQTPLGFYLLLMIDQRTSPGLPVGPVELRLSQYQVGVPAGANDAAVSAAMDQARAATAGLSGCDAFNAAAANSGSPLSGPLGTVEQSKLPETLQSAVSGLPDGQPSTPVRTGEGVSVLMVCERSGGTDMDEIRATIRSRLVNERLADRARRYLRDVKRNALVEIRQ
jgi:peptidyl-prolyl cis-trans isomerase SurA